MADMEKLLEGINLDDKKIQVDSKWYNADELKETVKKMIDSGDYENVGKHTEALKRLEKVVKEFKEISVKVPISLIEAYEKLAKESSKPIDYHLRTALGNYIEGPKAPAAPAKKEEPVKEEPKKEEPKKEEPKKEEPKAEEKKPQIEMDEEEKPEEKPEEKLEEAQAPKAEEEPKEEKKPPKVVRVACHNCKRPITITTAKRPITVICEHCGARGQLSS